MPELKTTLLFFATTLAGMAIIAFGPRTPGT